MFAANHNKHLLAVAGVVLAVVAFAARPDVKSHDYDLSVRPSVAAKTLFASAVQKSSPVGLRSGSGETALGVYYSEDGGIVIPPGRMVSFKGSGNCMDPHLPAPGIGEPVQFVNVRKLIHKKLRTTYDNLMLRYSKGDPVVMRNNPQHLVWAIRTAGKEDTYAGNLSESQCALLDECMGRKDGFMKFHRKWMRRNDSDEKSASTAHSSVSAGDVSYDASELRNPERGRQLIQEHMDSLFSMGREAKMSASHDLQYGEIDDGLYSEITSQGLSYEARLINASGCDKTFNALEYAAQVGNGENGTMRQRITMCPPKEIVVVILEPQSPVDDDKSPKQKKKADIGEDPDDPTPHPKPPRPPEPPGPIEPPEPPIPPEPPPRPPEPPEPPTPTNIVTRWEVPVVTVIDLEYDANSATGKMTVKIGSCTVKKARKWLSKYWAELLFAESHYHASKADSIREIAKTIPREAEYEATEMPNKGFTIYISFLVKPKNAVSANVGKRVRKNDEL